MFTIQELQTLAAQGDRYAQQQLAAASAGQFMAGAPNPAMVNAYQVALMGGMAMPPAGGFGGRLSGTMHPSVERFVAKHIDRLASARAGFDNSALTERGIRGLFYDALETTADVTWAVRVGLFVPSDTETEKHRWLGATPGFREWVGGLLANGIANLGIEITNRDYEDTISISVHDRRRDKTGHILRRIGEMAMRANNLWEELIVALLEANPTCYDQQALFSAAHASGDSGTLKNLLTASEIPALNVTTAARPTKAECAIILQQLASHFFTFKDDKGKKANQGARNFLGVVPPNMYGPMQAAVADALYPQGGTNELSNLGWNFSVVPEPELSSETVLYLFRTDAPSSAAFILQEEVAPHIDVIAEGSEHTKKTNEELYIAKTTRGVGPGEWRHVLKATLS